MRVVFAGSPEVAIPTLEALVQSEHDVVGVMSQPPRPLGRKRIVTKTPVGTRASALGVEVATPTSSAEVCEALERWSADIAIVVAYGRLLGPAERAVVPQGWWNVHFSLLPRWRGAAPVPHAIAAGDTETGVTLFRIDEGLDSGPIASALNHPIAPHETTESLLAKLGAVAPDMVVKFLAAQQSNPVPLSPQKGMETLAPKPSASVGVLRWILPGQVLYNTIRAWSLEPGCFATRSDNQSQVKVISGWLAAGLAPMEPGMLLPHPEGVLVGTGGEPLVLTRVQPAGKAEMTASQWFRGLPAGVSFDASG